MALLRIVSGEQELGECYGKLTETLEKKASPAGRKRFDLHRTRRMVKVFVHKLSGQGTRLAVASIKERRAYYILAGFSSSKDTAVANMDFQLAIPASGIERHLPCAFAKDGAGKIYLVHRGLFFGGRFTFKRDFFFDNYEGFTAHADDGAVRCKVAVLGELSSKNFVEWFAFFLQEVDRISATVPLTHRKRHRLDRKRRSENRVTVKAAIEELNSDLGKVKVLDGHGFGLYQPRKGESATASLEFTFGGETLVLEPTLHRDKISVVLYPRAKKRGRAALAEFLHKGFSHEVEAISGGEVGYEYDGNRVWYEVLLAGSKDSKKKLFVEYASMTVEAVVRTLKKR